MCFTRGRGLSRRIKSRVVDCVARTIRVPTAPLGVRMRKRTGTILYRRGGWWARVTFVDPTTGKRRDLHRRARTRAEACDLRNRLLHEIDQNGGRSLAFERATFAQLADWYEQLYLIEPVYVDDRRVAGLRSWETQSRWLAVLRRYFGRRVVRAVTTKTCGDSRRIG